MRRPSYRARSICYRAMHLDTGKARCLKPFGSSHTHGDPDDHAMDLDEMHDFITAHGFGAPTRWGYLLAAELMAQGDHYSTAAHEVVYRGLTDGKGEA